MSGQELKAMEKDAYWLVFQSFLSLFFFFLKHSRTTHPGGKPYSGLGPPTSIKKMAPPNLPTGNLIKSFSQGFPLSG